MNEENFVRNKNKRFSTKKIIGIDFTKKYTNFYSPRFYITKSIYFLLSAIMFNSFTLLFIKILFHSHHKSLESNNTINLFTGIFQILISLLFLRLDKIDLSLKKNFNQRETDYLLIRSILGFFNNHFIICALCSMRMTSAVSILLLSPVLTTYIIMKKHRETFKLNDKISIIMCITVLLIYILKNNDFLDETVSDNIKGIIYSLTAAILTAVNNVLDRKVNNEFHSYVVNFVIGLYTVIFSPILILFNKDKIIFNSTILSLYLMLAISMFFSFYFTYKTIELNPLLINSPLHYLSIGFSYLFSFIILNENFNLFDILVSTLVLIINFFSKIRMEECEHDDNL